MKKERYPFGYRSFLVREAGRRPRKLRIVRLAVSGKAYSLRCSSFSHHKRFAYFVAGALYSWRVLHNTSENQKETATFR